MMRVLSVIFVLMTSAGLSFGQTEKPFLLQKPALSRTRIVFVYAGDLWSVPRQGGEAQRLTTGAGVETDPVFSPDGNWIAFTGEYHGNVDVYVMPAAGGVPRRLTYHPGVDAVQGWTPDGKQVLFRSARDSYSRFSRLFTIPLDGAVPSDLPLPMAAEGCYSPDGARVAYVPVSSAFQAWKRYRGGRTTPIWIANLSDLRLEKIPRQNSNDFNPRWEGSRVYFLSDRSGPVTLFCYDTTSRKVIQLVKNDGLDIKSFAAAPDAIVYEQFGSLHLLDLKSLQSHPVPVRLTGDMPEVRPHYVDVARRIQSAGLSPSGVRAVFEARGEIFTVPADKGDARNLTRTPGAAERDPAWSPDGKWIAYFSDQSGEYELYIREQNGQGEVRKVHLCDPPTFYYSPVWSPDSKKIAFSDKRLNTWYVDLETAGAPGARSQAARPVHVDTDTYASGGGPRVPAWSPDSRWLAYTKQLRNYLGAVFLYSVDTGKSHQITDGMSDARLPAFDKNGKYLFFTASTDAGPAVAAGDMSGFNRPVTRSVYVVVLRNDLPSPLAPESDEEKVSAERTGPSDTAGGSAAGSVKSGETRAASDGAKPGAKEPVTVRIDLDDIAQRVLALPIPTRNYREMAAGKTGILFLLEAPLLPGAAAGTTLHKFDLATRKTERFLDGIALFVLSENGEKILYRQGERWVIAATGQPPSPGAAGLKLDGMEAYVDPRAEWQQIYHEVWRIERDFFYDPHFHGLDLREAEERYRPYLDNLASRGDLNYLFEEMLGELSVGHMFVGGGDSPEVKRVPGGLLGADYRIEKGRYRFARVYNGENWNPQLRAPLTQPGVNVKAGEYLLAVDGRDLRAADNLYRFFEATANKSVVLKVGPNPNGDGGREVTVVPVANETGLRNLAWIEDNRRKVEQMSGGRLAYVYLPDTSLGGYTSFNRYYFAQRGAQGAVIDERFNGGGMLADYIVDYLRRPLLHYVATREGEVEIHPAGAIFGPKAMIINEYAGSGGDAMPWYFRKLGIGPLVGKRTWGGLVGIGGYPPLMDGGFVTAPRMAVYNLNGELDVENHGVAPDIEVELDPRSWRAGHDPQLEKAVEVVLKAIEKTPTSPVPKPHYPNYHPADGRVAGKLP